MSWIASPSLGINPKRTLSTAALAEHTILTYARNTRPYAEIRRRFSAADSPPVRIFPSNSLGACIRMAEDGLGIATLPSELVSNSLKSGTLVELKADWSPSSLHFTASYAIEPVRSILEKASSLACDVARAHRPPH